MPRFNRRKFIQSATATGATLPLFTIAGTKASGKVLGANDTIRIAVAGINGRGNSHIDGLHRPKENVEVTYLVDPDSSLFESRSKKITDRGGSSPKCVQHIQAALEDKNLDAVSVATCNHWHSLMGIWACQAGKHAYIEKPISHNVYEGRKLVEAAQKYGSIVQHGTQQRSSDLRARQIAAIQSGKYGKLLVAKGYCCKPRWSINFKPVSAPPSHLDFNQWLGPAPKQPYHANLAHYNWHWFWDTGNGDTGNQGVHEMDVAHWAIRGATLPQRVWSLGGRFIPGEKDLKDQGETPNMQISVYEYDDVLVVFETRGLVENRKRYPKSFPFKVANEFYTTEGVIKEHVDDQGTKQGWHFFASGDDRPQPLQLDDTITVTPGGPFGSFLAALRSGDPAMVNCDAKNGHYSSALCHLGNISYRLSEPVPFRSAAGALGDNTQVVEAFDVLKNNLQAVDIDLSQQVYQLGRTLQLDPSTEKFFDDEEANLLLTRQYRKSFLVPDTV